MDTKPLRFISEPIEVQFDQPPTLKKKPGCPDQFVWQGETYRVTEKLSEWHDYGRRGRMAVNMRLAHAAAASRRGSWGVGRDYQGEMVSLLVSAGGVHGERRRSGA